MITEDMHVGTNLFFRDKPLCTYTICLMVRKYITIVVYYCIYILLGKILKISISSLFFKRNYYRHPIIIIIIIINNCM